jgi:Transmembrane secretion effector
MTAEEQSAPGSSAWAPFRSGVFRAMWSAQFVSNIGGWMQTVGAQWLMLSLTTAVAPVALIQTASSLPVLLFAVPAGAVGDLVDRRRFLVPHQRRQLPGGDRGDRALARRRSPRRCARARACGRGDPRGRTLCGGEPGAASCAPARRTVRVLRKLHLGFAAAHRHHRASSRLRRLRSAAGMRRYRRGPRSGTAAAFA